MPTNKNQISVYIYDKIKNAPGMAAITDRIVPEVIDTSSASYPYIVYSVKNNTPTNTKNSVSKLDTVDIIVTIVSKSYSELSTMSDIIRTALDYTTDESEGIQKVFFQTENFLYDDDLEPEGAFVLTQEYLARIEKPLTSSDTIMVFDTRIQGALSTPTNQLKLHFTGGSNDCVVDWGDGTTETISGGSLEKTHTYTTPGIYKVTFSGNRVSLKYDASIGGTSQGRRDAFKLLEIKNWGIFEISTDSMFEGCKNMIITATDIPTITTTSFVNMFAWCFNMTAPITMNDWDVSSVTTFQNAFNYCSKFNTYINDWDVSNGTNFQSMFNNSGFHQDLDKWNVSNGTNFQYMFYQANIFDGNVSTWQFSTTGSIDFTYMFGNARNFNGDVSNWNTERVTNMQQMFYNAHQFNQNLNSWDMSNVLSVYRMLYGLDFYDQPMDNWDISNIEWFNDFMRNSDGYSTANYDSLLISWGAQDVSLNESINFGSSQYTAGGAAEAARTFLITNKGWTITDGGAA